MHGRCLKIVPGGINGYQVATHQKAITLVYHPLFEKIGHYEFLQRRIKVLGSKRDVLEVKTCRAVGKRYAIDWNDLIVKRGFNDGQTKAVEREGMRRYCIPVADSRGDIFVKPYVIAVFDRCVQTL